MNFNRCKLIAVSDTRPEMMRYMDRHDGGKWAYEVLVRPIIRTFADYPDDVLNGREWKIWHVAKGTNYK
jgi:hypothetical protein